MVREGVGVIGERNCKLAANCKFELPPFVCALT